ncbi:MAG: hypothetical protein ACRDID_01265 [Ktedonobacterales bacterium]
MHTVLIFPEVGRVSPLEVWTGMVALTVTGGRNTWATRNKRLASQAR